MGNDRQCGNDAEFGVLQEGRRNQNAIDKIVKSVADQNQQAGTTVIMSWRLGVVRFAMVMMTMAPENEFFQDKEGQNTEKNGCGEAMRVTVLQRVRDDFQKGCAE